MYWERNFDLYDFQNQKKMALSAIIFCSLIFVFLQSKFE